MRMEQVKLEIGQGVDGKVIYLNDLKISPFSHDGKVTMLKEYLVNVDPIKKAIRTKHEVEMKTESEMAELILFQFNWRWKRYLKSLYTQQQFSREFRKTLKRYIKN